MCHGARQLSSWGNSMPSLATARRSALERLHPREEPPRSARLHYSLAFTLADFSVVRIAFGVPDTALMNFPQGAQMDVTVEALPGAHFRGSVRTIYPSADPTNRVFTVELSIPNPTLKLKPGMVASVAASSKEAPVPGSFKIRPFSNGFSGSSSLSPHPTMPSCRSASRTARTT